ncbi:hypothetical protein JOC86_000692 [Bacillus pakistanensis]|uniref:Lipoprotein n=1 Tax=Rossellomorea pakistanensis TaxID=992288 RepID=A0ABS2N8I1_9BACI|nr:hypothetical protein [Bacillus pakistanensis]MBM7584155.1 hypothetical protein [Bacillus pakistanensis]
MKKWRNVCLITILLLLLSACGNNEIKSVQKTYIEIDKGEKVEELIFHATISDKSMEPDTPFTVRFYLSDPTLRKALGIDMLFVEKEYKSGSKGDKHQTFKTTYQAKLKETLNTNKLKKIIENNEEEAVEVEVIGPDKVLSTKSIHEVKIKE